MNVFFFSLEIFVLYTQYKPYLNWLAIMIANRTYGDSHTTRDRHVAPKANGLLFPLKKFVKKIFTLKDL